MKFIARSLTVLLSFTLVALVLTWHIRATLGDEAQIDKAFDQSGTYTFIATQLQDKLVGSMQEVDPGLQSLLSSNIKDSVTPQVVRDLAKPFLTALTEWLNSPSSPQAPRLQIDLTSIKETIAHNATSDPYKRAQVRFEITKDFPDAISIPPNDGSTAGDDFATTLNGFKSKYAFMNKLLFAEIVSAILLLVLIVVLSIKKPRRMVRLPAIAALLAALIVAFIAYPLLYILNHSLLSDKTVDGDKTSAITIVRGLSQFILHGFGPYAIGLAVIAVVGIVASMFIPKPKDELARKK